MMMQAFIKQQKKQMLWCCLQVQAGQQMQDGWKNLFEILLVETDFGICLGHQAIAEVFGGKLGLAPKVMHGKQSILRFEGKSPIYQGIEDGQPVMRYHSILIEEMPEDFEVTARAADDNSIMAIQHKSLPIYGFQYHPESIGTPDGLSSIKNFIDLVK